MKADLIIKNGKLFSKTDGTDIAISGQKIAAIGTGDEIMAYMGEDTRVIDAGGNSVVPAFIDSHLHSSSCTELYKTKLIYRFDREPGESRQSYIDRMLAELKPYCDENPDAPIIRAVGWNPAEFQQDPEGEPTCKDLDKICPDRPMTMRSYDHHYLLVNSKALEMAGITKDYEDVSGGMRRDAAGNPTGLFVEMQAINIIFDNLELADFTVDEYKDGLLKFQSEYALPNGILGIFDAYATKNAMEAYRGLAEEGKLKIRVRTAILADPGKDDSQFDEMIAQKGKIDIGEDFKNDTVKFFIDSGVFGFYMTTPFEKEMLAVNGLPADYRGESQWSEGRLKNAFLKLSKAGFQIHVHCMGDAAVKLTLDGFEYVKENGVENHRNAIAHIQNIDERDIRRMSELGIIAAMQPSWPIYDGFAENMGVPLFGRDRILNQYPMGRIKRGGVVVSSGTDFPVMTVLSPFIGIQVGVTRKNPKTAPDYENYHDVVCGPAGNETVDCLSLDEMLESYTCAGAYQLFLENITGSIEPGKSADILILDRDLSKTDDMDIEFTKIESRIFKGEVI